MCIQLQAKSQSMIRLPLETSQIVVGDDMSHNSYFSFCVVNLQSKWKKFYLITDRTLINMVSGYADTF